MQRADALTSRATPEQTRGDRRRGGAADRRRAKTTWATLFKVLAVTRRGVKDAAGLFRGRRDGMSQSDQIEQHRRSAPRALEGVSHALFHPPGRRVQGVYASLNGGVGSNDDPAAVAENRARMARSSAWRRENFLVPYQVHSADALAVSAPWPRRAAALRRPCHRDARPGARASPAPIAAFCCSPTGGRRDRRGAFRLERRA